MGMSILRNLLLAFFAVLLLQCDRSTSPSDDITDINSQEIEYPGDPVFIRDRLGQEWDITHAFYKYDFKPENFQFGVGQFAIPPLTDPIFADAESPEFPNPSDPFLMLGYKVNGDIRAYAAFVMVNFEVANDWYGDTPLLVGYCPLSKLAAVYSREIDGRTLTFSASGWTYDYTFILYDRETESLWYHLPGENALTCVNGFYADRRLEELPSTFTRWNQWYAENPTSTFLLKRNGPGARD